jgi:hypothetical protein
MKSFSPERYRLYLMNVSNQTTLHFCCLVRLADQEIRGEFMTGIPPGQNFHLFGPSRAGSQKRNRSLHIYHVREMKWHFKIPLSHEEHGKLAKHRLKHQHCGT